MANYSFQETLRFFSEKLKIPYSEGKLEKGKVELIIDDFHLGLSKGKMEGSLHMELTLGFLLYPLKEEKLKELATGNFLGIDTGGCKLAFDKKKDTLCLHADTTPATSPQENWEWLHRLLTVARQWITIIALWDECVLL